MITLLNLGATAVLFGEPEAASEELQEKARRGIPVAPRRICAKSLEAAIAEETARD